MCSNVILPASYDRETWFRVPTSYDGKKLTIQHQADYDSGYYAYFAPYSHERHQDLLATAQTSERCSLKVLGHSVGGRDLDKLVIGFPAEHKKDVWVIGRQHPGESMAEWFIEGLIQRLLNVDDSLATLLLEKAVFHIIPNMNPDGSCAGNLRANQAGANLNREWAEPSIESSPEVYYTRNDMDQVGVDMFLDIHGDEAIPHNFIACAEGNPSYSDYIAKLETDFISFYKTVCPDFQDTHGYDKDEPGKANLTIASCQIGERFNCLSLTIEMPFKDNDDLPDPVYGWSAERSAMLGAAILHPVAHVLPLIEEN